MKNQSLTPAEILTTMRTPCFVCGDECALTEGGICACGAFVCHACEQGEEDGACDHDPSRVLPPADRMQARWDSYNEQVIGAMLPDHDPHLQEFLRGVFYAGAFAMFGFCVKAFTDAKTSPELLATMHALAYELDAWHTEAKQHFSGSLSTPSREQAH